MRVHHRLGLGVAVVASLILLPASASAFSFGVGVEGGASATYLTSWRALPDVGLILTQRFGVGPVDLTVWEDATPFVIYDGGWSYLTFDLGLRVGLPGPVFRPYVGLLVNDGLSESTAGCFCSSASNLPGLGGDVGFDVAAAFLRFGLELRVYETLIAPLSDAPDAHGFAAQLFLSVRAEF